ncbi:hypothetical protein AMIS_66830 [Actinoplanes missouriensis 431]|uniref:Uncharacterized protein n=1 Tax=Actinoplanes missouriensis (strain ATCC 14538 / DSM 43046 / CBS 188.64 / JCM 3121 / NBRC 102363 / NCIMB 12654 / NRRL B-3342 / UNCC 431) TaxID=512565 RepID=I0HFW6_ACTM4|nr:DUF5682 family protein [Actinoplanes missouriensis]BAL91903.1 hypothetical protein AMIS_66830 [Actinoplanes missouriensis 431]
MSRPFDALREQLLGAAEALADGPAALPEILAGMVDDVDHALREPLEIFPVCHHSPASALAMARRLREKQPKVIYLELCEDLAPLLTELRNCRLPVALQAFASELEGFAKESAPLSVVAPITEASAEYQAIAYALDTPGVELVLVDRSTDHVFQWQPDVSSSAGADEPQGEDALHGDAVGVEIGDLRPRFAELEEHLLHHGRVRHWSEWWEQYVEQPLAGADHDTYRQVMVMIGSLFRRLAPHDSRRFASDEDRERYMWTRIREHLARSGADRADCLYICGAFHASSRVPEAGSEPGTPDFAITERTATTWLYGLIPSSHSAIEAQFGLAPGSVSIAAAAWQKSLLRTRVKPFSLAGQKKSGRKKAAALPAPAAAGPVIDQLSGYLTGPAALDALDEEELRGWCVDIVRLARRNGYLASTADAIAVFETSVLLAGMRGRRRPTPYDFQDAAVTCIEKETVPGRRDVRRLCEILLGGDRIGQVGYAALPPLARDVYDRLAPLGLNLEQRTIQRALLDLAAQPELTACSQLLWMLRYLLPDQAVRPIMGSRRLGEKHIQESWDLDLGRHQRTIIELGYEGVTVEQVLEQRLRRSAWDPKATAATALKAVEDSLLFLRSPRLTDELGTRAVELLAAERTVDDAPAVLRRIRRLMAHYRATEPALPAWCERFVTEGYAHYCTLLPTAFVADDTGVRQVGAMLGFLFSMESLALSLGCDRTQLELAVRQSHPEAPAKVALLWAARHQLGALPLADLRVRVDELLANPLVVPAVPQYVSGFVQALEPVPRLAPFVVETLSKAFGRLPDPVLLPWLPTLITTLRSQAAELVPVLTREAGRTFPATLAGIDAWTPPWKSRPAPAAGAPAAPAARGGGPAGVLLATHPEAADGVSALLGIAGEWSVPAATVPGSAAADLLTRHSETAEAVAMLINA